MEGTVGRGRTHAVCIAAERWREHGFVVPRCVFWSGRWESNPRPKFGFMPPPAVVSSYLKDRRALIPFEIRATNCRQKLLSPITI